jgi:hypothetical protein
MTNLTKNALRQKCHAFRHIRVDLLHGQQQQKATRNTKQVKNQTTMTQRSKTMIKYLTVDKENFNKDNKKLIMSFI